MKSPKRRGQGMTENVITIALIAIGAIGVVTLFGNDLRALFGGSGDNLAGVEAANRGKGSRNSLEEKSMKTFGRNTAPAAKTDTSTEDETK